MHVDLDSNIQEIIWERQFVSSEDTKYYSPTSLDSFGELLVTQASAGNHEYRTLGYHIPPWPNEGVVLIDDAYGGQNVLWDTSLIFWSLDGMVENIRGYDFSTQSFFNVTDDEEYQFNPRIHKRRVVYMDLRLGESDTRGTWENGAIFMKDLDTGEVTQITDGAAIASYPDIYDDIIVWMDWRSCPNPNNKSDLSAIEIWGHNLATGNTFQITDLPEYQKGYPRIWGDKVFVQMFQGAESGIYMFDLPTELK